MENPVCAGSTEFSAIRMAGADKRQALVGWVQTDTAVYGSNLNAYGLVVVIISSSGEWKIKKAKQEAVALNADSISITETEKMHKEIGRLVSEGFSLVDECLVNLDRKSFEVIAIKDEASIGWLITGMNGGLVAQENCIRNAVCCFADTLGLPLDEPIVSITAGSYTINLGNGYGSNEINIDSMSGAGEIFPHHGYLAFLLLLYLQHCLEREFPQANALVFCDDLGKPMKYKGFPSIKNCLVSFFACSNDDIETFEELAVTLGLIEESLSAISTDKPSFYF